MTSTGTAGRAQPPTGTPGADPGGTATPRPPAPPALPLWWARAFPGEPPQVSQARSWVAKLLPACAPLEDLLLFTSELAANAVTHTRSGQPGGSFTVEVTWTPRSARVVVGDQGSQEVPRNMTSPSDQASDLESGRGLLLIDALSSAWGTSGDARARWLWADADWQAQGGPPPATLSGDPTGAQFAAARRACPSIRVWYRERPGEWCAAMPGTHDADATLSAPSPLALTRMLAARHPADRNGGPGTSPRPIDAPAAPALPPRPPWAGVA